MNNSLTLILPGLVVAVVALLLEAIATLAGLFRGPDHPGNHPA